MADTGGIRYQLNQRMTEVLTKALIDGIPEADETRVDSVSVRSPDLTMRRRLSVTLRNFDPMRSGSTPIFTLWFHEVAGLPTGLGCRFRSWTPMRPSGSSGTRCSRS